MAVAYDTTSENNGSGSTVTISHTSAAGAKGAALIIAHDTVTTDLVTGATINGVAFTRKRTQAASGGTDLGRVYGYFLGTSYPTGAQSVVVSKSDATTPLWACIVSLTGSRTLEIIDDDGVNGALTNPSLTMQSLSRVSLSVGGIYSDRADPLTLTETANWTPANNHDFGPCCALASRQITASASDLAFGYTAGLADGAMLVMTITETLGGATQAQYQYKQRRG